MDDIVKRILTLAVNTAQNGSRAEALDLIATLIGGLQGQKNDMDKLRTALQQNQQDDEPDIKQLTAQLGEILKKQGFRKQGKVCFRNYGDGVIQMVGFEYERHGGFWHLSIGLQSAYEFLLATQLVPSGCVMRYNAVNYCGVKLEMMSNLIRRETDIYPANQLNMFIENGGIEWLNKMDTQEKLLEGEIRLDTRCGKQEKSPYSVTRIAAYLYLHKYDKAEEEMRNCLWLLEEADWINSYTSRADFEERLRSCNLNNVFIEYLWRQYYNLKNEKYDAVEEMLLENRKRNDANFFPPRRRK